MQVGTSRASAVSRGVDYTFTWSGGVEYLRPAVFPFARWVHTHRQPDDRLESLSREMGTDVDQFADRRELLHVLLFCGQQGTGAKVRNHLLHQIPDGSHLVLESLIRPIGTNESASPRR